MKKFYFVKIKKVYEEIEFQFANYEMMSSFLRTVINNVESEIEISVGMRELPFSESDGDK